MFRTRIRKIWGDLWARKLRTFLVSASVFVGVFGVVTLFSTGELLVEQLEKDIQEERLSMLPVVLRINQGTEVDNAEYLEELRQFEGVTHIEGRAVNPLFWREAGQEDFRDGTIVAHFEGLSNSYVEPARLYEGDWPEYQPEAGPDAVREVAIERRMAEEFDLEIGDRLELRVLSAARNGQLDPADIQVTEVEIVGLLFQAYGYRGPSGSVDADTTVFAAYEDAQYIAGFRGLSALETRFEDFETAKDKATEFKRAAAAGSTYQVLFAEAQDPAENQEIESTEATNQILVALAFIALIVSGFLVVNVISAIISEQRRQIGTMKSLGATRLDNFFMYAGLATAYGVLGVVPGVLLGIPGGYLGAQGLAAQSNTIIEEFGISPTGIALGAVVGLAIPFLSSILPVINGTRVSILDAMTNMGIDARFGRSRLENFIGHLPLPSWLSQSVNNAFKKKGRLFLTGLTLTSANAAFMGIFAVFFALFSLVDVTFATFNYQIEVIPTEGESFQEIQSTLSENVEGLDEDNIQPGVNLAITIDDYDPPPITAGPPGIFALGFDPSVPEERQAFNLDYTEGEGWQEDSSREGVVITTRIAEGMGIGVGDEITIRAGGNVDTFNIIGVASYPFDNVWFRVDDLLEFGNLSSPNSAYIILDEEDPSARAVDDNINDIKESLLRSPSRISAEFTNQVELAELITQIIVIFGFTLSLAALLIALVGGIGLLTTLSISVFERQREIGVMRSVGASTTDVAIQFLIEGLIVGLFAWLLAVPLSLLLRLALLELLPFGDEIEVSYPIVTLPVGLIGMLVLVGIASLWPSFSASRKTVSDILRYQ